MILIANNISTECKWIALEGEKLVLETTTKGINPRLLSVFQICNVLNSAKELFKLKKEIKLLLFYGEGNQCEKNMSNLLLVFKDYFPKARIRIEKVMS